MKNRNIIFLGAGASASDGAPIQNQLFESYIRNSRYNNDKQLSDFFQSFFGIQPSANNDNIIYPTFEEVLGILEISLSREESFKGFSFMPENPKIQIIREKLIFLIAKILSDKLRNHRPNHRRLISRLLRNNELSNTSFISLNYDILIDNALTDIHDKFHLDYVVKFTNFNNERDWHEPSQDRSVRLYKLHGSLNWLYCPSCVSLTITPKEKSVSTIAKRPKGQKAKKVPML